MQTLFTKLFSAITVSVLISIIMISHAHALSPVTISYTIKFDSSKFGKATLGRIENTLMTTDTGYSNESTTKAQGMAAIVLGSNQRQSCEFEVHDGKPVSQQYVGGRIGKTDYEVEFDWSGNKALFKNLKKEGDNETINLPDGYIVDNCSMWFAVALLKGQIPNEQSMYVVDGKDKRIRGYTLRSSDEETLVTDIGEKKVTKVVYEREQRPDRTLTFWLSHEDEYLPLKMQESRKSRTTTFEVNALAFDS